MPTTKEQLVALSDQLESAVKSAGIADAVARAFEGPFIPYGATGDTDPALSSRENAQLYFDEQHDYARRRVRDAYFGVEDSAVRGDLIRLNRDVFRLSRGAEREELEEEERKAAAVKAGAGHLPWGFAACTAGICVVVGYWVGNIVGAVVGALVGYFVGQGTIENARREDAARIVEAENALAEAKRNAADRHSHQEYFSAAEEVSVERDSAEDRKSAFADRLREYSR